ncbi:deoxyguanosinetriphosphate triphosphohydrolase [Phycicoccus endophyticus]|uniref:Deoxyguanosinetriphosphate triphosphohydrolase n=1 Tax=Phycicoccus endophyticus TaxID=1690220 RepID=A0A7G9R3X9_9MICO|nr:deoxyguanosinetriphosphate triphosphohydrolase [Phycicoccus endophyticus]NHI18138.1 deoxyguanosinetriphosphate triphosphohydrolase [Phycicoccus endophyticus]QNN50304.1 deoxyguanosinetriphosphate triphosphohydrolase [Phycicoccus endophyticus]GGL26153.1 deoxyguanosinetriphosphate triphosphohydrolase-like protein [Phycicoccus endophyticus]
MTYAAADRERWVAEDPALKRSDRDEFARDRARVLHSAALRRLSAKTQVVAPSSDDFVRNRLTHTLEVAQIGRELGAALGCNADVVDTACLAHDLGHPPFGHNGEAALDAVAAGIGGFEGNAQTLRLLTRLEAKRTHPDGRPAGLNLTRASLDAATKYPWHRGGSPTPSTKFGVYEDDLEVFAWLRAGAPAGRRAFEAEVMDWADDVAYCVHDVEDAVASGWLDPRRLRDPVDVDAVLEVAGRVYEPGLGTDELGAALERVLASGAVPREHDGSRRALAALKDMTSRLIGRFAVAVETATREAYGDAALGRHEAALVVPGSARAETVVLKAVAAHFVMLAAERVAVYEEQREVVAGLVAAYTDDPSRLDPDVRADHAAARDDAAALRVVVDQVASLTDVRAHALHRRWSLRPAR